MIIVGAGGHAKEVADEWVKKGGNLDDLEFFDDVNELRSFLGRPVHRNLASLRKEHDFIVAVGNPQARRKLFTHFLNAGHRPYSMVAHSAEVSSLGSILGRGLNIMSKVVIGPDVTVADGVLLNSEVHLHHDSSVGAFCEISPRVSVLGSVTIQSNVSIGTGAILLPGVVIGEGAIVGAAAMVNRNVAPHSKVIGIPARPV